MGLNKGAALVVVFLVFLAAYPAPYFIRWLSVLFLGAMLAFLLFDINFADIKLPMRGGKVEVKNDVERTVALIKKARKGKVARSLIEERIIEIYAILSDDYSATFNRLRSNPNAAVRALRSEGDFLDSLEKALEIVEDDLNED